MNCKVSSAFPSYMPHLTLKFHVFNLDIYFSANKQPQRQAFDFLRQYSDNSVISFKNFLFCPFPLGTRKTKSPDHQYSTNQKIKKRLLLTRDAFLFSLDGKVTSSQRVYYDTLYAISGRLHITWKQGSKWVGFSRVLTHWLKVCGLQC